jgi:hypothetical protein
MLVLKSSSFFFTVALCSSQDFLCVNFLRKVTQRTTEKHRGPLIEKSE